jgi:hypothetical protein
MCVFARAERRAASGTPGPCWKTSTRRRAQHRTQKTRMTRRRTPRRAIPLRRRATRGRTSRLRPLRPRALRWTGPLRRTAPAKRRERTLPRTPAPPESIHKPHLTRRDRAGLLATSWPLGSSRHPVRPSLHHLRRTFRTPGPHRRPTRRLLRSRPRLRCRRPRRRPLLWCRRPPRARPWRPPRRVSKYPRPLWHLRRVMTGRWRPRLPPLRQPSRRHRRRRHAGSAGWARSA